MSAVQSEAASASPAPAARSAATERREDRRTAARNAAAGRRWTRSLEEAVAADESGRDGARGSSRSGRGRRAASLAPEAVAEPVDGAAREVGDKRSACRARREGERVARDDAALAASRAKRPANAATDAASPRTIQRDRAGSTPTECIRSRAYLAEVPAPS